MASLNSITLRLFSSPGLPEARLRDFLDNCASPVVASIARSGNLKANILISGLLLDAIAGLRRDLLAALRELSQQGRIEVLAGFYGEPRLSSVRPEMRKHHFGRSIERITKLGLGTPAGAALPGFGWEPEIVECLNGIRYVVIDERYIPETDRWSSYRLADTNAVILPVSLQPGPARKSMKQLDCSLLCAEAGATFSDSPEKSAAQLLSLLRAVDREGSAFVLNRDLLSLEPPFEMSSLSLRSPSWPSLSDKAILLGHRFRDLQSEFGSLPPPPDDERYKEALQGLLLVAHRDSQVLGAIEQPAFRNWFHDAALRTQVAIDALREPDVDPSVGWVRLDTRDFNHNGIVDFVVDTQLARWYITGDGRLVEFDYKPRKLNFSDVIGRGAESLASFEPFFCYEERGKGIGRLQVSTNPGASLVTKRTLDLLTLRLSSSLQAAPHALSWNGSFLRDLTFKAGVGAHLSNSTTGFSVEYWLEGDTPPPPGLLIGVTIYFRFPSSEPSAIRAKPLLPVGAVSDDSYFFDAEAHIPSAAVPGGIFGIRLIDGLEDLTMDVRSAKQLSSVSIAPVMTASSAGAALFQGMRLEFIAEARRLYTDDRTNTLFISIV